MSQTFYSIHDYYISHHGVKGQKWGIRRYQNPDGSLTAEGLARLRRATDRGRMAKSKKLESTGFNIATAGAVGTFGGSTALLAGVNPIIGGIALGAGLLTMGVGSVMQDVAAMREKRNWNFVKKVATNYSKANPAVPKSLITSLAYAGYSDMLKRPASEVVEQQMIQQQQQQMIQQQQQQMIQQQQQQMIQQQQQQQQLIQQQIDNQNAMRMMGMM